MVTVVELSLAGIKGGNAPKHRWTEEERQIVRRDYAHTNASAELIAAKLGVTRCAVKGQCAKMGILKDKSPDWTKEDINRLYELIPQYSPHTIARKLHRSENAVVIKAKRLGLSRRCHDGWYTKKEVCEILGIDHKKVQNWIDTDALKASRHTNLQPQKGGMAMWHILQSDLRRFIIHHCFELMGRNVDLFSMVQILIPNEIDNQK